MSPTPFLSIPSLLSFASFPSAQRVLIHVQVVFLLRHEGGDSSNPLHVASVVEAQCTAVEARVLFAFGKAADSSSKAVDSSFRRESGSRLQREGGDKSQRDESSAAVCQAAAGRAPQGMHSIVETLPETVPLTARPPPPAVALELQRARAGGTLMRRLIVALPHFSKLAPVQITRMQLQPSQLHSGEHVTLTLDLTASSFSERSPPSQSSTSRSSPEGDEVEVEVQPSSRADWVVVGALRQRLSFLPPLSGTAPEQPAQSHTLMWNLIPLRAGYLELPLLGIWRLHTLQDGSVRRGARLPSPPYPSGSTTLVRPRAST